jgi:hypothetical protein
LLVRPANQNVPQVYKRAKETLMKNVFLPAGKKTARDITLLF